MQNSKKEPPVFVEGEKKLTKQLRHLSKVLGIKAIPSKNY